MTLVKVNQWNIEVSEKMYDVLSNLFLTLGMNTPSSITANDMEMVVKKMNAIVQNTQSDKKSETRIKILNGKIRQVRNIRNALVVSKLGIIRYQLKVLLNNSKVDVMAFENQFTGLAEYVKKLYDLVIIDISDNTDDSIDVIKEIKRLSINHSVPTTIIVLAVPAISSQIKNQLLSKGVDKIIEKKEFWYDDVMKEINQINHTQVTN